MFASRTKSNALGKRDKPYSRKTSPMSRSSSLLGTIKNIVSAPLTWFASNQGDFEDLGKRRRVAARDAEDLEEQQAERTGKRLRVDSPERSPARVRPSTTGGYLDPPSFKPPLDSHATRFGMHQASDEKDVTGRRTSIFGPPPPSSGNRTMSVDPASRYATFKRDPTATPLPADSPTRSSPARSVAHDDDSDRPRTPLRLRTSLTPQPSPSRHLRRESSAPPPISNLKTRPAFVKPPAEEKQDQELGTHKTISLGTLAEVSRGSRGPGQGRTLSGLGRNSINSDQISPSDAILQPSKSLSERTFHELELYKTPILPSRYKDASEIPAFLKPKRSHVPVPMSKKGRVPRPSLGTAERYGADLDARDDGKPYARKNNVRKIMTRRKQEEEEEDRQKKIADSTLTNIEEDDDDEMETDVEPPVVKRDVGVSAQIPSGSEDERMKLDRNANATVDVLSVPSSNVTDPFGRQPITAPGGRQQPYGRVGRARTREPGQRSVPLSRPLNKLSATPNDDESVTVEDEIMMDVSAASEKAQDDVGKAKAPAYEAPKGFSFPSDTSIVNHDHSKAKEPPIQSLPFSLGSQAPVPSTSTMFKPPAFKLPASSSSTFQSSTLEGEKKKDDSVIIIPSVSVEPATPDQQANEAKKVTTTASFFTAPSGPSRSGGTEVSSTASRPSGIPNFFANSQLLAGDKPAALLPKTPSPSSFNVPTSNPSPATPVKDPENPLWDGNKAAPSAPPKLFAGAVKPFDLGSKPVEGSSASSQLAAPLLSGGPPKQPATTGSSEPQQPDVSPVAQPGSTTTSGDISSTATQVSQAQPAPAKQSEPEKKPNGFGPSPFFNFGAGTTSNVPKPLFGTGSPTVSSFPSQPSQPAQNTPGDSAPKPVFTLGQPQTSETANKTSAAPSNQSGQNAPTATEQKSPFPFGAPPMSSSATDSGGNDTVVAAPKPLLGGQPGGTGFTFGSSAVPAAPATPSTDAAKPANLFAFGAPPATPPAGERQSSPYTFGTPIPSAASTGFTFGTPVKQNEAAPGSAPSTPTNASPFAFGTQPPRPVTPPSKPDEGMNMEESPVQMDTNNGQKRPASSITFGAGPTPVNPFGQSTNTGPAFTFGAPPASNPFGPKDENKPPEGGGFNFNRTASAPAISTSFSFGVKSDQPAPPATAFGAAPPNPFTQTQPSGTSSTPFTFGQQPSAPVPNPFAAPSQPTQPSAAPGSAPSSPFANTPAFTFGAPAASTSNPFSFGSSAPSSPATGATGLPQASGPSGSTPAFIFGQPSGSGSGSGGGLFNIGAPPPNTAQGTSQRSIRKLPRRANVKR
ncbi:hypothetical protein ACEPAF_4684 [Sanghuangporus sanghuang]